MAKKIIVAILIFILLGIVSVSIEGTYVSKFDSFFWAIAAGAIGYAFAKEYYKPDERLEADRENVERELRARNRELSETISTERQAKERAQTIVIESYAVQNDISAEALYDLLCRCSVDGNFFAADTHEEREAIISELLEFRLFWTNRVLPCIKRNDLPICFEQLYEVREAFKSDYYSRTPLKAKLSALVSQPLDLFYDEDRDVE